MNRCRRRRRCGQRHGGPRAPGRRPRHARRSAPGGSLPPGTPGRCPDRAPANAAGLGPGHSPGSAARTHRSGAWSPCEGGPTRQRTPRPRQARRLRRRPSATQAAAPIMLPIARRFSSSESSLRTAGNVGRRRRAAADGLLSRPRIGHKSQRCARSRSRRGQPPRSSPSRRGCYGQGSRTRRVPRFAAPPHSKACLARPPEARDYGAARRHSRCRKMLRNSRPAWPATRSVAQVRRSLCARKDLRPTPKQPRRPGAPNHERRGSTEVAPNAGPATPSQSPAPL